MISSKMLIGDRVIRDSETGSVSIINIVEDISAESFPILVQKIAVLALLEKSPEDGDTQSVRFRIYNNDKVLGDHQIKVDFRGKSKTKAIIQIGGTVFEEPGQVNFVILHSDQELDRYSISLKLRENIVVRS